MTDTLHGFIYIDQENPSYTTIKAGDKLTSPTKEQPLMLFHDTANITVHHWPGTLWFAKAPSCLNECDTLSTPVQNLSIIQQIPETLLFGSQGANIIPLINKIPTLALEQIEQLALLATPMSAEAYSQSWNNWLKEIQYDKTYIDGDYSGTLAIGVGEYSSPIYSGFLLINELVSQLAQKLEGQNAFTTQVIYGEKNVSLAPHWSKACSVLLQSAMGLGATHYVAPQDLELLLAGWELLNKKTYRLY